MDITSRYHEGERRVQEMAGVRSVADANGRVLATTIPAAARRFIAQQSMAVLGSVDGAGYPWASVLFGAPGFLEARGEQLLVADLTRAWPNPDDPLWLNLRADPRCGMLLIELSTRRRLRVNGRVRLEGEQTLLLQVEEAYPNCPKYIQRRHLAGRTARRPDGRAGPIRSGSLRPEQQRIVRAADTFFVASTHPERGADSSHRGGKPGFVQALDEATLRIPDYAGNAMFNTLGNLTLCPHAGLVFLDFEGNRTVQLRGDAEIRWDVSDPEGVTGGTSRFWDFHIAEVLELPLVVEARWELLDPSPFNP